jgi:PAS domain S-box-containing protein
MSVVQIREVGLSLDRMNRVSVPMTRALIQLNGDAEAYRREIERRILQPLDHGKLSNPIPEWVERSIESQLQNISDWISKDKDLNLEGQTSSWSAWNDEVLQKYQTLRKRVRELQNVKVPEKTELQSVSSNLDAWVRQVEWGVSEHDRLLRARFSKADSRVSRLRTGLEVILGVVVALSLLLLWLSERALRPLAQLSEWVRKVADRGVRREDKSELPQVGLNQQDEVGDLAREFHVLTTTVLEREKELEDREERLQQQNLLLSEMSELNWSVLASMESMVIVVSGSGKIAQVNPAAAHWLGLSADRIIGQPWNSFSALNIFSELKGISPEWLFSSPIRLTMVKSGKKVLGGKCIPLRSESAGWMLWIDDLTEEVEIQERLHQAESLAAVGRMSAQVAHEVRNPLHSIGLEAEHALELVTDTQVKVSLQSILKGVGRLQEITNQYLRMTRLSMGEKKPVELADLVETVLATYANACEELAIQVDWRCVGNISPWISCDRTLIEQSLGNLVSNAIEALKEKGDNKVPKIRLSYGLAESGRAWLRFEDNGPGISESVVRNIFQPFVTSKAKGTGLGLSFVKRVIEEHLGSIEAWPEGHDPEFSGACFEIRIPACESLNRPLEQNV